MRPAGAKSFHQSYGPRNTTKLRVVFEVVLQMLLKLFIVLT